MNKEFNYIFEYLERKNINIDQNEFIFQLHSHPDFPSLLSIVDTLSFFNIENDVFRIQESDLKVLPNSFIAVLNEENKSEQLYFIERNNNIFRLKNEKRKELNYSEFISKWTGIVMMVDKPEYEKKIVPEKRISYFFLIFSCISFLSILILSKTSVVEKLFVLFPIIGFLLSLATLKDLIGGNNEFLNNFCNISSSTSCSTVINSKKWKLFEILDFSNLSIVFFSSQLISLIIFSANQNIIAFFQIQQILLLLSLPIILISVYYQKFVEKKWCPICLAISLILMIELIFTIFINIDYSFFLASPLILFTFIFSTIIYFWSVLKPILARKKELKDLAIKGSRFIKDYETFKYSLTNQGKFESPNSSILIGNSKSKFEISILTNPFCGHCKSAHEILENMFKKHKDKICFKIIFPQDLDFIDDNMKQVFRIFAKSYFENGQDSFLKITHEWFNSDDKNKWLEKYSLNLENENYDKLFKKNSDWANANNLNFTPVFLINGYQFPKKYDRRELDFFVNELIEDKDFN